LDVSDIPQNAPMYAEEQSRVRVFLRFNLVRDPLGFL
jgi:hypothetical protein